MMQDKSFALLACPSEAVDRLVTSVKAKHVEEVASFARVNWIAVIERETGSFG